MNMQLLRNRVAAGAGVRAAAAMLTTGALVLPARALQAQDAVSGAPVPAANVTRTITVVGEGKVKVEPDSARVNIGVEVMRPTVREASDANEALIDSVIAAVQGAGVAEEDIQTSGFSVYSVYAQRFGPNGPLPEEEVNYRVSNNVNVTVRDLASVSNVLGAAIEAGANTIYGVEFAIDNTDKIDSEARAAAVANARAKAEELAALTGVTVGQVVAVSEVIGNTPIYSAYREQVMGMGGGNSPTIQPGQLNLTLQLQVVYAIE